MKKTTCIKLVLITAALAACNRPMYQQEYYSPGYDYPGDPPDSTNACPIEYSQLPPDYYNWLYGFRPFGGFYIDPYINAYYVHPRHGHVVRSGFGGGGHSISS